MTLAQPDRRLTIVTAIGLIWIAAISVVYALSAQLGELATTWAVDSGDVLVALGCTALCFILWRSSGRGEDLRRVWMLLGIGLGMWAFAEIFYATFELVLLQPAPSPSLADLLWVPAYIPIVMAFWIRFRILRVPLSRAQWIGIVGGFVVMGALSVAYVILPNVAENTGDVPNLVLGIFYAVGDLLIAFGGGLMIIALTGGRFSRVWALIAFGFFAIAVADGMYYAGYPNEMYAKTLPINLYTAISDISYFLGYLTIALGLFEQAILQRAL